MSYVRVVRLELRFCGRTGRTLDMGKLGRKTLESTKKMKAAFVILHHGWRSLSFS
jgi:hypothetical protein